MGRLWMCLGVIANITNAMVYQHHNQQMNAASNFIYQQHQQQLYQPTNFSSGAFSHMYLATATTASTKTTTSTTTSTLYTNSSNNNNNNLRKTIILTIIIPTLANLTNRIINKSPRHAASQFHRQRSNSYNRRRRPNSGRRSRNNSTNSYQEPVKEQHLQQSEQAESSHSFEIELMCH